MSEDKLEVRRILLLLLKLSRKLPCKVNNLGVGGGIRPEEKVSRRSVSRPAQLLRSPAHRARGGEALWSTGWEETGLADALSQVNHNPVQSLLKRITQLCS